MEPTVSLDPRRMSIEDQVKAMRHGVAYRHPVKLRELTFLLRPLTMDEALTSEIDIRLAYAGLAESRKTKQEEEVIRAKTILVKASTSGPGQTDATLNPELFKYMTDDELIYLFDEYRAVKDRVNPTYEEMDASKLSEIVDFLKKSPKVRSDLIVLSWMQLANLVCHLIGSDQSQKDS